MSADKNGTRWSLESKVFAGLIAALLLALLFRPFGIMLVEDFREGRNRQRLLNDTDHRAVALACRDLIRNLGTNEAAEFKGTNMSLPPAIRLLNSHGVYVYASQVRIAFGYGDRKYFFLFFDVSMGGPFLQYDGWGNAQTRTLYTLTPSEAAAK